MSKKILYVFIAVLVVALIGAVIAIVLLAGARDVALSAIVNNENELGEMSENVDGLTSQKDQLTAERDRLNARIAELEAELTSSGATSSAEIEGLRSTVAALETEISELSADIEKYRTVFNIDVRSQAKIIDEIDRYISEELPYARLYVTDGETGEVTDSIVLISDLMAEERKALDEERKALEAESDGEIPPLFTQEELEASGLTEEEFTEKLIRDRVFAREDVEAINVSIYYEDLSTGYHFGYNDDHAYNSASVVKAPYVMSVLREIAKDEAAYFAALAEQGQLPEYVDSDGDGEPDKVKIEYSNPLYDLSEKVVYDSKTMYRQGSGVIKDMDDGTEFTYLDFCRYVLEESDNVAYAQLRDRFGYNTMTNLAYSVGARISGSTMTAKGAGKLFKAIWEFIESDSTYGDVMRESMRKAEQTDIIPMGVYPTETLHKYGWDEGAYHDAAIVLAGDKPYVLTVFTDIDCGGTVADRYLQGICKLVSRLHSGFYAS